MDTMLLEKYRNVLTSFDAPIVRDKRLLMEAMDAIEIYYAPFEYINPEAKIVLVGITPGPTQMVMANNEVRRILLDQGSAHSAIKSAKQTGAFSGEPLRGNLIRQLNHWGFDDWLNLDCASDLFGHASDMIQSTSLLRYPVFVNGNDYRGKPDMTKHPLLRRYLLDYFVKEVNTMKEAVFLSLGPQVQKVMKNLVNEGVLEKDRLIGGLLHPSGNCTYRINYLIGERNAPVPHATNPVPYDEGRVAFRKRFLG